MLTIQSELKMLTAKSYLCHPQRPTWGAIRSQWLKNTSSPGNHLQSHFLLISIIFEIAQAI